MEQESTFGARLRGLMEERGLSYEQLGTLLGRNPQTLNRYVLGRREPRIGTAASIARALEVDPLWLQGYDVPRTPPSAGIDLLQQGAVELIHVPSGLGAVGGVGRGVLLKHQIGDGAGQGLRLAHHPVLREHVLFLLSQISRTRRTATPTMRAAPVSKSRRGTSLGS